MAIVAATVANRTLRQMREIIDIKHGGIEGYGITCRYLGTSVSIEKVVDAAIETAADAILISTIITHADIHRINMRKLHELCKEKGIRDKVILVAGGTQVTNDIAVEEGMDAGFGRGTHGHAVASFLVETPQPEIRRCRIETGDNCGGSGSTTTVVSGFSDLDAAPRLVGQGQGPTTVEAGDVRQGLKLALADLRANLGCDHLEWQHIYACSSAAGGLKMTVHGLVYDMTARAAREAALGAGAVLHQVTAGEISPHDLEKTRQISPNIILLAGGVDYGERNIILDNARKLATLDLPIPLIYAGNVAIQAEIADIFAGTRFLLNTVENVYPRIDELNIEPTRKAIQQAFEEHIIHAPGMSKIREVVDGPIQPVPGAVLNAAITLYGRLGDLLVFDVGGATTDLHSVTWFEEVNAILISPGPWQNGLWRT